MQPSRSSAVCTFATWVFSYSDPLSSLSAPVADSGKGSGQPLHAFWLGLTTQLSNPKTAIVYASVLASFLPASFSLGFAAALLAAVFMMNSAWYVLVALLFSSSGPQRAYTVVQGLD